jgi:hypothetical protein
MQEETGAHIAPEVMTMRFGNPARLFVARAVAAGFGLAMLLLFTQGNFALAAKPDKDKDKADTFKRVKFNSPDGVELSGKFYAVPKGVTSKDATVLMLHDFTQKTGGDSEQDEWAGLAEKFQGEGYAVLTFDFRGHGDSKSISPQVFWAAQENRLAVPRTGFDPKSPPTSIDQKNFPPYYYLRLIDDINGAKAYLDRKSMNKELNSSNIIVVGAGQGATLGAMWMYSQYRLHRVKGYKTTGQPDWDEAEGRDISCGIWLTMAPKIEGTTIPIKIYMEELEKTYKVPMFFMYGKEDTVAETETAKWLRDVMPNYKLMGNKQGFNDDKNLKLTRDYALDTKLTGSKLLNKELSTDKTIVGYLEKVLEVNTPREARMQDPREFAYYYWTSPNPQQTGTPMLYKNPKEDVYKPMSLKVIKLAP